MQQEDTKSKTNPAEEPKVETHAEAAPDLAEAETEVAAAVETIPEAEAPLESTTALEMKKRLKSFS